MIKNWFFIGLVCILSLSTTEAQAYSTRSKIYIGADYVYSDIKYKNNSTYESDNSFNSISPVIGFSSYGLGLEAFYQFSDKKTNKFDYESSFTAYGIDLTGEAPLSENFSVIVSIGLAKYKFEVRNSSGIKYHQGVTGPRFGIGLQYEILPHIALRTMFHYTSLNSGSTDIYDAVSEFSGGIRIVF